MFFWRWLKYVVLLPLAAAVYCLASVTGLQLLLQTGGVLTVIYCRWYRDYGWVPQTTHPLHYLGQNKIKPNSKRGITWRNHIWNGSVMGKICDLWSLRWNIRVLDMTYCRYINEMPSSIKTSSTFFCSWPHRGANSSHYLFVCTRSLQRLWKGENTVLVLT